MSEQQCQEKQSLALLGTITLSPRYQTPRIAQPVRNLSFSYLKQLPYLKDLSLNHAMSDNDNINISMLIGADTYWSIVQEGVIQGPGPTVIKSKLGYLLQDHCAITAPCQHPVYFTSILYHCVTHQMLCLVEMCGKLTVCQTNNHLQEHARDSVTCQRDGPNLVKFPWKPNHLVLPTNHL